MIALSLWKGLINTRSTGGVRATDRPAMASIIRQVAEQYGAAVEDVLGPSRGAFISEVRHAAMYECRAWCGRSYPAIGRAFNRHHTSVMHGVRRHMQQLGIEA
jgi:chromosomal replication initiation ATPase DnaA